jgi:hypothetical protein
MHPQTVTTCIKHASGRFYKEQLTREKIKPASCPEEMQEAQEAQKYFK